MSDTEGKTSMGLDPNIAGLLCYLGVWITGLIFILLEKENKFVRFHAMQSIVLFGAYSVLTIILSFLGVFGAVINGILGLIAFVLWIVLMVKAYQGEKFKLPVTGDIAEKQVNK